MQKKEILIKILERLVPYRDLAEGLLFLVKESEDEEFIVQLYELLLSQIKSLRSNQAKETLRSSIQQLKAKEEALQQKDNKEVAKLFDDLINNLEE